MFDPLETLAVDLETVLAAGDAEDALRRIVGFVRAVNADPTAPGHVFASQRLDGLLARTAEALDAIGAVGADPDDDPSLQIYVASEIYLAGGHTRVLEDFIAAQPGRPHRVFLTNLHRRPPGEEPLRRLATLGASVTWPAEAGLAATARWVARELARHPRARVFMFVHHEDAPAWAGCLLARPSRLFLCHHADHHLALGLFLPGVHSIELSSFSYHHSRDVLGLADVTHVPLTTREIPPRPAGDFAASPREDAFVTCSSGNAGKFAGAYPFSYAEVIAERLARFGGTHLHIGGLDDTTSAALAAACSRLEVDPARLRHLPQVPDLAASMGANSVSLYLSSFPIVGARAAVEVMSSGTPIIGHTHLWSEFLGGGCLLPAAAPAWHRPADLWSILAGMTPDRQVACGAAGRIHWEENHRPGILARCLEGEVAGVPPPPRHAAPPDPLHGFFSRQRTGGDFAARQQAEDRLVVLEEKLARLQASLEKSRDEVRRLRGANKTQASGWIERVLRPLAKLENSLRKRLP